MLAQIAALVGLAQVAARSTRFASETAEQLTQKVQPIIRLTTEMAQTLQPTVEAIGRQSKEIGSLVSTRAQSIQAAYVDTSRRAERIRLRLTEGVGTVDGRPPRRGIYRQVAEPVQTASHVVRGLKLALWLFRKVA